MIRFEAGVLSVKGPMTIETVASLKSEAANLLGRDLAHIELSEVSEGDSAGLALLIDWLRASREVSRDVSVSELPLAMASLAALYGLSELFPARSGSAEAGQVP